LFVALGPVVNSIGNIRVRNQGTLGGNLAFGEPRSDWITSLVALDATVALVSPSGVRTASLAELLVDAFQVDRAPAELIETVDVKTSDLRAFAYRRVCRGERPLANVACASRGDAGAIKEIVLAVGACTAVPSVTRLSLSELDGVNANDLATGLELFDVRRGAEVAVRSAVVALLRDVLAELKALK
jgi:carbon-monoxide dehydrogenase medium subunit